MKVNKEKALILDRKQRLGLEVYEVSDHGYRKCVEKNPELAELARNFVFDYIQHGWRLKDEAKRQVFQKLIDYTGFNLHIVPVFIDGEIKWRWTHRNYRSAQDVIEFRYNLFARFKRELQRIEIDDTDGLLQECVEVANLVAKYKHLISLERNKLKHKTGTWSFFKRAARKLKIVKGKY